VFNFMREIFRPDTRAVANLYMRLADAAELGNEATQFEKVLSYWTAVEETESLTKAITEELKVGDVSPQVVWSIVNLSKNSWPPARRLALLEAYGTQCDGIPLANRFAYFVTAANILLELGRSDEAIDAAGEATVSEWPEPRWRSETVLHNVMGLAELALGRLNNARNWLESALRIASANLPPKHADLASTLSNLALVLTNQGHYDEAGELIQRALRIEEEVLGPKHLNVATTLNNLAGVLNAKGYYDEAGELFQRALTIEEEVLGPKHPNVATTLGLWASMLNKERHYDEAGELFQRALTIEEEALGPKHPNVATTLNNLAGVLDAKGHYGEAGELFQRALAIMEKALGPNHPYVAAILGKLAMVLKAEGHPDEARELLQRALLIKQSFSAPDPGIGGS
jgi:tetratricopeptide (TPR) repeat protein